MLAGWDATAQQSTAGRVEGFLSVHRRARCSQGATTQHSTAQHSTAQHGNDRTTSAPGAPPQRIAGRTSRVSRAAQHCTPRRRFPRAPADIAAASSTGVEHIIYSSLRRSASHTSPLLECHAIKCVQKSVFQTYFTMPRCC